MTESSGRDYTIRYAVLHPTEVSEYTAVHPSEGGVLIQAGEVEFGLKKKPRTHKEPFYLDVEASVLKDGFKNPVCCISTEEGTFAYYGTTRLAVAQKNALDVPCLIADYVGRYSWCEELDDIDDILDKHTNAPSNIQIGMKRMNLWGCA